MPPLFRKSKNQKHLPAIPFDKCAAKTTADGKPGTCVVDHCINVGRVAEALIALQPERVKRLFPPKPGLSVSVHDVGKVSPGYENKYFRDTVVREYAPELCSQMSFSTHHAAISAAAIDRLLGSSVSHSPVALAAAAHHGKKDKSYPPDTAETLGGPAWSEERQKLIERLSTVFGGTLQDAAHADPWLLAGLTCVSDWIGSDEMFFPADRPPVEQDDAMLTARRAVAECGFVPAMTQKGLSFEDVFGFAAHPPQRQFIDRVTQPGLYVLEAPMGIGKTEAALYAAYKLMEAGCHQGLYFALPTRLTSDRIHARVSRFLARISEAQLAPKLAHGMAWLYECRWRPAADDDDDASSKRSVHAWFNPSKRALLYPYAVGTIDQALLGVLNVKHNFVRLFGLAGKVVILDEVHSYDIYTGTLLDELAERLLRIGCTVIVLSATLTGQRRTRLAPALGTLAGTDAYPLITGCPENGRVFAAELAAPAPKKVHVRTEAWDNLAVATEAVSAARRGECVVCIANTVAKAQVWYRAVKTVMPENAFPVGILHARFPMFRREQVEDEWMARLGKEEGNRPEGCVLIATQIVEQSVDIDADRMITELAPSDMLLQRMGRLWRHPRDNRPCPAPGLIIISQDLASCASAEQTLEALGKENACVYAPYVLMRTFEVWKTHSGITLPHDIRTLIEDTYVEREEASDTAMGAFKIRLSERCERLRKLACSAKDSNQGFPSGEDDERAATRYSDLPTQSVLLLAAPPDELAQGRARVRLTDGGDWLLDAYRPDFEATRRLHANTVSVAAYLLSEPSHTRNDVAWLNRHFYDKPVVLVCDGRGVLCDLNGAATVLRYSPEYGVWRGDKTQEIASEPSDAYSEDIVFDNLKRDW
ncbi:MAG: CRISPR-associated helicase Cas3' [Kiritimatiellia bacterium]